MKNLIILTFTILVVASCSSLKVTTDYDSTIDFTKYKSYSFYGWADGSEAYIKEFDRKRVEKAFAQEFDNRNIEFKEKDGDLIVSLYVITEQKTQKTANTYHYGGWGGYYGYGPGYGWGGTHSTTTITEQDYTVGTLIVSVFDAEEEKLVWETVGQGTMEEHPRNKDRAINFYVAKMMKEFPLKPSK